MTFSIRLLKPRKAIAALGIVVNVGDNQETGSSMNSRDLILVLRSADHLLPAAAIARQLGLTRQWVSFVLAEEKLPTRIPKYRCLRCGGYVDSKRGWRGVLICYNCQPSPRRYPGTGSLYQRKKALGICHKCALPAAPGRAQCPSHLALASSYHVAYYRRTHPLPPPRPVRLCTEPGCGQKHAAHGLCHRHYLRDWNQARRGANRVVS